MCTSVLYFFCTIVPPGMRVHFCTVALNFRHNPRPACPPSCHPKLYAKGEALRDLSPIASRGGGRWDPISSPVGLVKI